jgi:hypothetical protein
VREDTIAKQRHENADLLDHVQTLTGRLSELERVERGRSLATVARRARIKFGLLYLLSPVIVLALLLLVFLRSDQSHWYGNWRRAVPGMVAVWALATSFAARKGKADPHIASWSAHRVVVWASRGMWVLLSGILISVAGNLATSQWAEPLAHSMTVPPSKGKP